VLIAPITADERLTTAHRAKLAYVYVRQSHAVMLDRCSIIAYHACSTHLHWRAATDGMYASSRASPVSSLPIWSPVGGGLTQN
jgi:hypothetical protein